MKPSAAATYERARRLANSSMWAIHLQHRRLHSVEPEDGLFVFRKWTDLDFLIVSLIRLRRAAGLAHRLQEVRPSLAAALSKFDAALPHLKRMRDVAEHIDDYAIDEGRDSRIRRQSLEVSSLSEEGPTIEWLGSQLNANDALLASQKLFEAIKDASNVFEQRA